MSKTKKEKIVLGQFFTPNYIADFMIKQSNSFNESENRENIEILETSCGNGVFLESIEQYIDNANITAYEIDKSVIPEKFTSIVTNDNYLHSSHSNQFDIVIGNPPYIRWKNLSNEEKQFLNHNELWNKYCNNLCDYFYIFILKAIQDLKENGELIFIVPDYFYSTTNAKKLREHMIQNGYFEWIILFNENKIFKNVNSSITIFKYIKGENVNDKLIKIIDFKNKIKINKETIQLLPEVINENNKQHNELFNLIYKKQFTKNDIWSMSAIEIDQKLCTFKELCATNNQTYYISDICDIANGMVSGLDKAFQIDITGKTLTEKEKESIINIAKAKHLNAFIINQTQPYIFLHNQKIDNELDFQKKYPNFYQKLKPYEHKLNQRYEYKKGFTIPYYNWSLLRNIDLLTKNNNNEKRIFAPIKDRQPLSNNNKNIIKTRFAIVDKTTFPTQDVIALVLKQNTKESVEYITAFLNLPIVLMWLTYNGIVKGNVLELSEKVLSSIPFRKINWSNQNEVLIHNQITNLVKKITKNDIDLEKTATLIELFEKLFNINT